MRPKKPRHKRTPAKSQVELFRAEVGPEDGTDPGEAFRGKYFDRGARKTLQLCKQVERALSLVLAGEADDRALQDLQVLSVEPAPNASRLLVTVCPSPSAEPIRPLDIVARLSRASGKLRSEIAASIHRKKTPELAFRVFSTAPH
jgi:ribosome-binding factor A